MFSLLASVRLFNMSSATHAVFVQTLTVILESPRPSWIVSLVTGELLVSVSDHGLGFVDDLKGESQMILVNQEALCTDLYQSRYLPCALC